MKERMVCFVVMGYGVKTDYASGRELDLDKTYKNIIKPAAEEAGLDCIRADEIRHSGIIDIPMYKYLISADIVIADLSTDNSNAFYELGVRHSLRPYTTIAIAEKELKYPFDVNHTVIRQYEHLGKDIGYDEVIRFRKLLKDTILEILNNPQTDSPVYTFLNNLKPPKVDVTSIEKNDAENNSLSAIIDQARNAMDNENDFEKAKAFFEAAHAIDKTNCYIIQKLALVTYKAKKPSHVEALYKAIDILKDLKPEGSTDPETLGLSGAIYKRLWEELNDVKFLNTSIYFYERGFFIKKDYYNGINLSFLLNIRSSISMDINEAITDYVTANRIRRQVVDICKSLINSDFESRSDQYWILATMEEALFALNENKEYAKAKAMADRISVVPWQRGSTNEQISKLSELIKISPLIKDSN